MSDARRSGVVGWITRRQGWLFFPMITLEGVDLHVSAVRTVAGRRDLRHRRLEAVLLAVQLVVFSVYMGASFAPNHKGMPLLGERDTVDFLRRQVLTSRNIRGGRAVTWAMGGLNHQIEHHLFPRMPSVNLARARPIVREYCAERDIPYTETGLIAAYGTVVRYLNRVGIGEADPSNASRTCHVREQFGLSYAASSVHIMFPGVSAKARRRRPSRGQGWHRPRIRPW